MNDTDIQLLCAIIGGFLLLALSVGAFALHRARLGVVLLVLAAAATLVAYPLVGRLAQEQEDATRAALEAKYAVDVTQWGAPLGDHSVWRIDGQWKTCELDLSDREDPVMTCTDALPPE